MPPFLILDDSPRKMTFLREILARAQWQGPILTATTTEEATEIIDRTPDIAGAFIDYYVPEKNGPAVIAYLREKCPHAKIALVSSSDSTRNAKEATLAGADAVVCSGYEVEVVEERLMRLLAAWKGSN